MRVSEFSYSRHLFSTKELSPESVSEEDCCSKNKTKSDETNENEEWKKNDIIKENKAWWKILRWTSHRYVHAKAINHLIIIKAITLRKTKPNTVFTLVSLSSTVQRLSAGHPSCQNIQTDPLEDQLATAQQKEVQAQNTHKKVPRHEEQPAPLHSLHLRSHAHNPK